MKSIFFFLFSLFIVAAASAEKVFDFNSTCQQAYQEITKLKVGQGLVLAEKARKQNPENLIPLLLEDYAEFFQLFFNEDPNEFKKMMPHLHPSCAKAEKPRKYSRVRVSSAGSQTNAVR